MQAIGLLHVPPALPREKSPPILTGYEAEGSITGMEAVAKRKFLTAENRTMVV
jgi:hypothetical protein